MIVVPLGVVISHLTGVADTIEKNPDVVVPLMLASLPAAERERISTDPTQQKKLIEALAMTLRLIAGEIPKLVRDAAFEVEKP